jgi:arylsulfatase A-like enzyme
VGVKVNYKQMKLNRYLRTVLVVSALLITVLTNAAEKPNVIVIFTDDQGSVDLNIYGTKDLVTPNMDAIAASGVRFTQFYAASSICSPSRASMLTGKTCQRAGVPGNVSARPGSRAGLPTEEYTMAEMFKDAGYKTAKVPNAQGFDYSFGHMVGCIDNYSHFFYWSGPNRHDLYRNNVEIYRPGEFFPDMMVEEASMFMEHNKRDPFFIYFAINLPHYPYQGDAKWLEYYREKGVAYPRDLYAAFLSTQDDRIGMLIKKLEDLGLKDNTIIVFQGDNGHSTEERAHHGGGSAGIYRGAKQCLFEGGIRVPAAISWPGHIKAGEVRDQFSVSADWMPTLADLCGVELDREDLDGKSLVNILDDSKAKNNHSETYCWHHNRMWAARSGKWKLLGNPYDTSNRSYTFEVDRWLVDLENDPGERTNLAKKYPEKVKELEKQFRDWQKIHERKRK